MSAIISDCGRYRYRLERSVDNGGPSVGIIMVNPSTADATEDDATIRKLRGFADWHGWGEIIVCNLFAYRATDVKALRTAADPVGPDNDLHIQDMLEEVDSVLVAWGTLAKLPLDLRHRWCQVADMIHQAGVSPYCLGNTVAGGQPRHPLMPGYETPLCEWDDPRDCYL